MKITRRQLRQIIKEGVQATEDFESARSASLASTSDEPFYYYNAEDSLMHTLVNGNVVGNSPKVVYGDREYKNNWATLIQANPEKFFGPTPEEAMLAEGNKMKITSRQLKDIIMNEVSSYQMSKYDQASSNMKMIAEIIIVGMETLTGQKLSQEEKYEYGEEVIVMLSKYMEPAGQEAISDIFMEIRTGGGFKDPEPESVTLPPQRDTITTITDPQALERLKGPKSEK